MLINSISMIHIFTNVTYFSGVTEGADPHNHLHVPASQSFATHASPYFLHCQHLSIIFFDFLVGVLNRCMNMGG